MDQPATQCPACTSRIPTQKREFAKRLTQSYSDHVDTLLVYVRLLQSPVPSCSFAQINSTTNVQTGLLSATLSYLLVHVASHLDMVTTIEAVTTNIQQLHCLHSSNIDDNATSSFPCPSPVPSSLLGVYHKQSIRVENLFFTSLVLAVFSASLCMLMRSWLRSLDPCHGSGPNPKETGRRILIAMALLRRSLTLSILFLLLGLLYSMLSMQLADVQAVWPEGR